MTAAQAPRWREVSSDRYELDVFALVREAGPDGAIGWSTYREGEFVKLHRFLSNAMVATEALWARRPDQGPASAPGVVASRSAAGIDLATPLGVVTLSPSDARGLRDRIASLLDSPVQERRL